MSREAPEKVESSHDGRDLLTIAKLTTKRTCDVVGVKDLKDETSAAKVTVNEKELIWKKDKEQLMKLEE